MTAVILLAALVAVPAGDFPRPEGGPTGLSGVTHVTNDLYYAVNDAGSFLLTVEISVDRANGRVTNCAFRAATALKASGKLADLEGVAWDAAAGVVWATDEYDGTIRSFDPATGERRAAAVLPPVQDAFRFNRSLEALALAPGSLDLWACNEEALCAKEARRERRMQKSPDPRPETMADDGPRATRRKGTRVRIMRLSRVSAADVPRPAGEWAYETDPVGGLDFLGKSSCGVADMAVLGDGTLLVMERELSIKRGKFTPSFRCRIYAVDVSGADDVSNVASLKDFAGRTAGKTLVWGGDTGFANYEGLCEGPRLADGSRTLVLVSDADAGAAARVMTLVLKARAE